jgi:uncharacterized protein (DUF885 family)
MKTQAAVSSLVLLLGACAALPPEPAGPTLLYPNRPTVAAAASSDTAAVDARLQAFLDAAFDERVAESPQFQTQLGLKTEYDKLDDYTAAADARTLALMERQLADMRRQFDPNRLGVPSRLSFRLFQEQVEQARRLAKWRDHNFLFAANSSPAGSLPVFLINSHRVDTVADAQAYVARLREVERVMGEIAADFEARAAKGIAPPRFVYEPAIGDARNVLKGAPFTSGPDTALWADFKTKVGKLDADAATKARLLSEGQAALTGPFRRGYDRVLASLQRVAPTVSSNDGVWRLPDGEAYYRDRVRVSTTTELTPDQVHQIGLSEVARIQAEMEVIKQQVGFKGTLQQFFAHLKDDPRFEYPNTDAGKQQYLADSRAFIAQAMAKAPQYFHRLPKAPLEVRAVEEWRQATASVAFYNRGTGRWLAAGDLLREPRRHAAGAEAPDEGIAYHEGAPGHHFQIAFAQEQGALPKFRRFGGYTAYSKAGGCMPRSSARRWASTRTRIPTSAGSRSSCGGARAWSPTRASTPSAGRASGRWTTSSRTRC